jgi:hypothetical protein
MNTALTLAFGVLLAAASMDGHAQTGEEPKTAEAKPASAPPAEEQTEEQKALAELSSDNLTEKTRKRITKGFSQTKKDDVDYYCRKEMPIGSRLAKRQCYTIEQLADMEHVRILTQRNVERKQVQNPTTGT